MYHRPHAKAAHRRSPKSTEVSATSLLASQGTETLAFEAFLRYADGDYTVGSAYSVLMVALALGGSLVIARISRAGGSALAA